MWNYESTQYCLNTLFTTKGERAIICIQAYFYRTLMRFSKHGLKHNFTGKWAILLSISTCKLERVHAYNFFLV